MKAHVEVWESDEHVRRFITGPKNDLPYHGDGLIAKFTMNPHDAVEWDRLRERMLRAVEARQCIVISG